MLWNFPGGLSAVAFCAEAALSESGGAGTGKTTAVRAILAALEAVRASLPALQRHVMKPHPKAAWVRFDDGAEDAITIADLERLTHGWAISVHKAQGSAFKRVIIPVVRSKLLDRTLLYIAITRGIETVVLWAISISSMRLSSLLLNPWIASTT